MEPHVAILMGTLNGAAYLPDQLASIVSQTHTDWSLHVSDDGSGDATRDVLNAFQAAHPRRRLVLGQGPRQGSAANYFSMLENGGWPEAAWVALSDQDDVWMPDRIAHAIAVLTPLGPGPAIYASRTMITDMALRPVGPSRQHPRRPEFGNALPRTCWRATPS